MVEVDGSVHDEASQVARDARRTQVLESRGYTVIRFTNDEVLTDPESVCTTILDTIYALINDPPSHP